MREKWARRIVLFTGLLVLLLAAAFAFNQNPTAPVSAENMKQTASSNKTDTVSLDSKHIADGPLIYKQQTCARCHAIAGQGNPRNSLDGIGAKYTASELRDRITGADRLLGVFPAHVLKLKQKYRELSEDDLEALIIYMQSLR